MLRAVAILLLAPAIAACGNRSASPSPSSSAVASTAASATPSATAAPAAGPHVFVVVMENRSLTEALANPDIRALAARSELLTNYHAVAHPSLPNYLALTSGSTWGITSDSYTVLPARDLGSQLTAAHVPWRAYMEGMNAGCFSSGYPYALKHNPFAFYGGRCPRNVVPLGTLDADLASGTAAFSWISPGLCHDGHDCSLDSAAAWLRALVTRITASATWQQGGVLIVTWDEDDRSQGNAVATLVLGRGVTSGRSAAAYDHYSLLRTIEEELGLAPLGEAAKAKRIAF